MHAKQILTVIVSLYVTAVLAGPQPAFAARQKVCVKPDGKVVIKRKCKLSKSETELNLADISLTLQGEQGIQGPQGEQGLAGPQGDQGEQGPPGLVGYNYVKDSYYGPFFIGSTMSKSINCPDGYVVSGGSCDAGSSSLTLISSYATGADQLTGWSCIWGNSSDNDYLAVQLDWNAICILAPE